jgi:hypothetical protein
MGKTKRAWRFWVAVKRETNKVCWVGTSREDVARYWRGHDGKVWRGIEIVRVNAREA